MCSRFPVQAAVVVFCVVLLVEPAGARSTAKQEAAKLLKQGNRLNRRHDLAGALKKYRAAYRLYASYKIKFNIGGTLYNLGRYREAAETLEEFLVDSADVAPKSAVADARRMLSELEGMLASVMVRSTVTSALVKVRDHEGEKALGFTPLKARRFLLPAHYRLVVEKKGHARFVLELDLKKGDHAIIDVPLKKAQPASIRVGRVEQPGRPGPAKPARPATAMSTRTVAGYATLATGLALVATAGVLYGLGGVEGSAAHDDYQAATTEDDLLKHREIIEKSRTKLLAGHVLAGIGLAAVGVSVYLLVSGKKQERRAATLNAAVLPGGGLVGVSGRF